MYFVFAIFKMHSQSQQPKRNYYNVETKIERDLQAHGRVVSLKWLFLVKMVIYSHLATVRYVKPFKISIKHL